MSETSFLSSFLSHLDELRHRFIRIIIPFFIFTVLFIAFRFNTFYFHGFLIFYPYPDVYRNAAAQFIMILEQFLLPSQMQVIVLKPADAVVADFYSAMFLSLLFTMPVAVNQLGKFIMPALKKRERTAISKMTWPAALLFAAGAFIGLYFVAPELFMIFYAFDIGLGAAPEINLLNFVNFVLIYIAAFGLSFELPVIMVGLTRVGLVPSSFWKKNWRYAVVGALVFGMIFSPGVTGFTMVIMALPIIALYFGGIFFAQRAERNAAKAEDLHIVSEGL